MILFLLLFSIHSYAQIQNLDPLLEESPDLFEDQINPYLRVIGIYMVPSQMFQGQYPMVSGGIYFSQMWGNFSDSEKRGLFRSEKVRKFSQLGMVVPLKSRVDLYVTAKRYEKTDQKTPYSYSIGMLYNFSRRSARTHFAVLLSFAELKRNPDFYLKSLYTGAQYKSISYRLDYIINFGIMRTLARVFPDLHPQYRKEKITNLFLYQLGANYHLTSQIHIQFNYLKSDRSQYLFSLLLAL